MNTAYLSKTIRALPWWSWVVGIDLFFVVATIARRSHLELDIVRRGLKSFDLGREMNLATWWSSILLLTLGMIGYELFCTKDDGTRKAWLLLSIALTILSLDEIGSLHERVEDWIPWVDPYIPIALVGLLLIPYPLFVLLRHEQTRRTAVFLVLGFLLFATIAIQERLEGAVHWRRWRGVRLGVEEGTELLGMFVCYWGIVRQRSQYRYTRNLSCAVPNVFLMWRIPAIATGLLGFHLAATIFVAACIGDDYCGRTLVWYPVVIAFVLFSAAFWRRIESQRSDWLWLAIFFLACSASVPYMFYPSIADTVDDFITGHLYLLYTVQLILITGFYLKISRGLSRSAWWLLCLSVITLAVGANMNGEVAPYVVSALFAYLVFHLFWPVLQSDH